MSNTHVFKMQMTSDELQAKIDSNDGTLFVDVPWHATREVENAESGDRCVITVTSDKSAWIGEIEDVVTLGEGYAMHFMITVK